MSDPAEVLKQSKALVRAHKETQESEQLLERLPQGHGSGLNADCVDGLHAAEIIARAPGKGGGGSGGSGTGDMTKAVYDPNDDGRVVDSDKLQGQSLAQVQDHAPKAHANEAHSTQMATAAELATHEADPDVHHAQSHTLASHSTKAHSELTGVTANQHHAEVHAIDSDKHTGTLEDSQFEGTAGTELNTPNTSSWGEQGTARKVLVFDSVTGKPKWEYLVSYDVHNPAKILSFYARPQGSYPDGSWGVAMVASSGQDTPEFQMTYQGTPSAAHIHVTSETEPAGYPTTVSSPFTSHVGPAVNRKTSVGSYYTFRLDATIDGQEKNASYTIYYYNERMWGVSSNAAIDTQGEIDTFRGSPGSGGGKELSNSRAKTFTVTAGSGEYIYYIYRAALGDATFKVGGFEGGFSKIATVSWQNPRGFTENYYVWRSDQPNLGYTTVEVT